jgi:hypothetical protein
MLKKFGDGVASVGKSLGAIGAAVTVPLTAMAKLSADAGASLYDMSRRTGISTEALSRMGFVASLTGSDLDGGGGRDQAHAEDDRRRRRRHRGHDGRAGSPGHHRGRRSRTSRPTSSSS